MTKYSCYSELVYVFEIEGFSVTSVYFSAPAPEFAIDDTKGYQQVGSFF